MRDALDNSFKAPDFQARYDDPAAYRHAATLSLIMPIITVIVSRAVLACVTAFVPPAKFFNNTWFFLGWYFVVAGTLIVGIVFAVKALFGGLLEMGERPAVRSILGILFNFAVLAGISLLLVPEFRHRYITASWGLKAQAREMQTKERKVTTQESVADLDRTTATLEKVLRENTGQGSAVAKASKALLSEAKPLLKDYAAATEELEQPPIMDMTGVTSKSQLREKKQIVMRFLAAHNRLEAFLGARLNWYRDELRNTSVRADSLDTLLKNANQANAEEDEMTRRIRADNRARAQAMLSQLDLLEFSFGKWNWDLAHGKIVISDAVTLDKFIALRDKIDSAERDRDRYQAKLMNYLTVLESSQ